MQRKGGDKNVIVVKNLDTINTSAMEKCKKCEDNCTCDPNLIELGGAYSMSKTTRKEKEQGYGIHANNNPPGKNCNIPGCFVTHGRGYSVPGSC